VCCAAVSCALPGSVQVIDMDYVNEAMKRMEKGDVKFRFVIDINKSLHL
jgi:cinnamyl-alcohol dehydrogenase